MATKHRISPDAVGLEIARLQWANALMRAANKALAKGDRVALDDMGFSLEHVDELQANGGFPSTSIRNNTQMITYLQEHHVAGEDRSYDQQCAVRNLEQAGQDRVAPTCATGRKGIVDDVSVHRDERLARLVAGALGCLTDFPQRRAFPECRKRYGPGHDNA